MKKLMFLVLSFLVVFSLTGCFGKAKPTKLDQPQNVIITEGVVTWTAVKDATSYQIVVGSKSYTTTKTTFDLNTVTLTEGSYSVTVLALKKDVVSTPSQAVAYVIEKGESQLYSRLLKLANPTYEPEMVQENFNDPADYAVYMQTSMMMFAISQSMDESSLSEDDAFNMTKIVYEMPTKYGESLSMTNLISELNQLGDFGMANADVSKMAMSLFSTYLGMTNEQLEAQISLVAEQHLTFENTLATRYVDFDVDAVKSVLQSYVPTAYLDVYNDFFDYEVDASVKFYTKFYIQNELIWLIQSQDYMMNDFDSEYHEMFYYTFTNLYNDNIELFNSFSGKTNVLLPYYDMLQDYIDLELYVQQLMELNQRSVLYTSLLETYNAEKVLFNEVFTEVFAYISTFYSSIPTNILNKITDTDIVLEISEIIIIKDELLDLLITTMPTTAQFEKFHELMAVITSGLSGKELVLSQQDLNILAQIDVASFDLTLHMLKDIDLDDITAVMLLANDLYDIVEVDDGTYLYEEQVLNVTVMFELASYLLNFVDETSTKYQTKVDTLNALNDSDAYLSTETIMTSYFVSIIKEQEIDSASAAVLDMLINDKESLREALDILNLVGVDFLNEFMATNGLALAEFINMINTQEEMTPDVYFESFIGAVLGLRAYNDILLSQNTEVNIEAILSLVKLPLKAALLDGTGSTTGFDAAFDRLLPLVSTMIHDVATLEVALFARLDAFGMVELSQNNTWMLNETLTTNAIIALAFNDAFTPENKLLFMSIINQLFDGILVDPYLMGMLETTEAGVLDTKQMMMMHFQEVFEELALISTYDLNNLTFEQEDTLYQLPNFIFSIFNEEQPS